MSHQPRISPKAADQIGKLAGRDLEVIRANLTDLLADPHRAGRPSSLGRPGSWQHVCPSRWVLIYRWSGHDTSIPADQVLIEDLVPYYL